MRLNMIYVNSTLGIHQQGDFMRIKGQGGFTLIELMVLTAIICIIAAISYRSYHVYYDKVQTNAVEQNTTSKPTTTTQN